MTSIRRIVTMTLLVLASSYLPANSHFAYAERIRLGLASRSMGYLPLFVALRRGYAAGLKGEPDIVNRSYDLFISGYTLDLSVAYDGIQVMLDEDINSGVVDRKMTLDRVINDRILKQAQQELKAKES